MIQSMVGSNTLFVETIENIVWELDVTYIEAVLEYCRRKGLEEETVGSLVKKDPILLAKIQNEAEELRILPSSGDKLPI